MIAAKGLALAGGRYELDSRIAVGGMGEVWRGRDAWAQRTVAIKVLRPEYTGDESSLHRLRVEAHNAAMLSHPNIAKVHDYREEEGTGYLVLEYVSGQSLADLLADHMTLTPKVLVPILHQCAQGLFAAHEAGVVHRDVKPGNVLITPSGHVKLTDFGISVCRGQAALTATGKVMGTAHYLAPEQALGKPATPSGDMYALGIIAFECLVGSRPFSAGADVDIALAQVRQPPPPLPDWVDPPLRDLIDRLLLKDPALRPASCAELAHELAALPGLATTPAPVTAPITAGVIKAAALTSGSTDAIDEGEEVQPVLAPVVGAFNPTDPSLGLPATATGGRPAFGARLHLPDPVEGGDRGNADSPRVDGEEFALARAAIVHPDEAILTEPLPPETYSPPPRRRLGRGTADWWVLLAALLCIAAIVVGFLLSGGMNQTAALDFGNNPDTRSPAASHSTTGRGIMSLSSASGGHQAGE
ncbi:MAG: protein kinase [Micrococcales bacterium]|nr:protein kinase [Micrococcales bacterium]